MNSKASIIFSTITCSLLVFFTSSSFAYVEEKEASRWFEIEVILFEQLGDKKALNEEFPDNKPLPKYLNQYDLIKEYALPNISVLKRSLPSCEPELFAQPFTGSFAQQLSGKQFLNSNHYQQLKLDVVNNTPKLDGNLVAKANKAHKESTSTRYPYFPEKKLCSIPKSYFKNILSTKQYQQFKIDELSVEKFSGTVNSFAPPKSDSSPYLIAKSSLRLNEVSQKLRSSHSFKPLLHFGWRQIGLTKNKSIPLKIIAGENIELAYQKALVESEFQQRLENIANEIKAKQALNEYKLRQLNEQQSSAQTIDIASPSKVQLEEVEPGSLPTNIDSDEENLKQIQIQEIISKFALLDTSNVKNIIDNLGEPTHNTTNLAESSLLPNDNIPTPIQPWFLDGFIKIHLDHYLYITADMNMMNQSFKASQKVNDKGEFLTENKAINFSQNRRVISGEVHYFDHPYMGMVIQIRRFDPTKPEDEAVSQAVR
ncbi:MAG: CsiV family protein [Colwellia sp.]